jgi:hypothetical protein
MTQKLDTLQAALEARWATRSRRLVRERGEITITVPAERYLERGAHAARRSRR